MNDFSELGKQYLADLLGGQANDLLPPTHPDGQHRMHDRPVPAAYFTSGPAADAVEADEQFDPMPVCALDPTRPDAELLAVSPVSSSAWEPNTAVLRYAADVVDQLAARRWAHSKELTQELTTARLRDPIAKLLADTGRTAAQILAGWRKA